MRVFDYEILALESHHPKEFLHKIRIKGLHTVKDDLANTIFSPLVESVLAKRLCKQGKRFVFRL